ncbi:ureidoglycolate lyase [Neoroseomonas soli]|uniref:Ureidoglycolate hydrolase n=1 Tax=Neoroseomonas soli TaxID=1081025 RepID=A0A9X9X3S7_9PROT|nr:ureidoglycolate lyase [Neoroseomonas soli]MBR0674056.1 ureidoglycolate hydrolase [Neoroseomonas soli]
MRLIAEPLTAEAFAPFGEVLAAPDAPGRVHIEGALANRRPHAKPTLYFTCKAPSALPLTSTTMERHLHSSQSFVPMDAGQWLVIVAPHAERGGPDMARARAFLARPDQGVTYGADVWHHPLTVIDRPARFATFMWKDGTPADDEFFEVAPFEVHLP